MTQHHRNGAHVCTLSFAPFFRGGHVTTHRNCIFVFAPARNILSTMHTYLRFTFYHH